MFGTVFQQARRAKRLSGVELAKMAGTSQSAISQFEGGKRTALRRDTIEKICEILEIAMPPELAGEESGQSALAESPSAAIAVQNIRKEAYCPNAGCPSNVPYVVDGTLAFMPRRQPDSSAVFCPWCGEVLLRECPKCETAATRTAFCPSCGAKRVEPPEGISDPVAWAEMRRAEIASVARYE